MNEQERLQLEAQRLELENQQMELEASAGRKRTPREMYETGTFLPFRRPVGGGPAEWAVPTAVQGIIEAVKAPGQALKSGELDYLPGESPAEPEAVNTALNIIGGSATKIPLREIGVLPSRALRPVTSPNPLPGLVEEFQKEGYKLPPSQMEGRPLAKVAEGLAGSAKLEKLASVQNQQVTNRLVAEDLGLPTNRKITEADLENVRKSAGAAYEQVKNAAKLIKPDEQFRNDLKALRGDFTEAAKEYPEVMSNKEVENLISALDKPASPRAMVELTKKLRKDAATNLKSFDDPAKRELGLAQRGAATAIEEMIDRGLSSVGKSDLVDKWRAARTTIAKSYDAEAAFNETRGEFSARTLAGMYKRGKPLSGGMEKAARFARAFEGSARDPGKIRDISEFGFGDLLLGGLGSLGGLLSHGGLDTRLGLTGLGLSLARPLARRTLLTGPVQQGIRLNEFSAANRYPETTLVPALGLRRPQEDQQ